MPNPDHCSDEDSMESPTFDELMGSKNKRYVATGNTYPHRELFASWAWHWDTKRRAWIEDNGTTEDERGIVVIKDLPGVVVRVEEDPCDQ